MYQKKTGVLFIKKDRELEIGSFVKCKITDVRDYDLVGEIDV